METCQYTIRRPVRIGGVGLHSGRRVRMSLLPAPVNTGIRFLRTDGARPVNIPATIGHVTATSLATSLGRDGVNVATVEHLLAALTGCGVDNAIIELDEGEVPIMDGSAEPFVQMLKKVKRRRQQAHRRILRIVKPVTYRDGDCEVRVTPFNGRKYTCAIDFPHEIIRQQSYTITLSSRDFVEQIATARTFGFLEDIHRLRELGLALGGSLENAVVIGRFGVLNEGGLRFADEFVRHKILDLIGDLSLMGSPILGHVSASKAGHGHHLAFMRHLVSRVDAWEWLQYDRAQKVRRITAPQRLDEAFHGLMAGNGSLAAQPMAAC